MIDRYTREKMATLWSDRARYVRWLEVELAVARFQSKKGLIPSGEFRRLESGVRELLSSGGVDPARVAELEHTTRHDVLAFTSAVSERLGPEGRWIHFGLTSSDVVDTASSMALREAGMEIETGLRKLEKLLRRKARDYRKIPCLGRTHGMVAEPTSFGLKFLGWAQETGRNVARIAQATQEVSFGKLSGAVGCNAILSVDFEEACLASLGLKREPVSTQVVPRDRHAAFVQTLALAGCGLERIAIELRHLQRTEVGEVREGFTQGQKGSSAMPHKRNPISSENITGCARLLRAYASASMENIALWHERDISHSSVERVIFADATQLLDYAVHRMTALIENLEVDLKRIRENLERYGGVAGSGQVLLALVRKGVSREDAYAWVQGAALRALNEGGGRRADFRSLLVATPGIREKLTSNEVSQLATLNSQLRGVSAIYAGARASGPPPRRGPKPRKVKGSRKSRK